MRFVCYAHLELQGVGGAPAVHASVRLLPSAFGGAEVLTLSIKVLGGFPASELSGNQDADVGVAAPPTFQLCFQAKSSQKSPF